MPDIRLRPASGFPVDIAVEASVSSLVDVIVSPAPGPDIVLSPPVNAGALPEAHQVSFLDSAATSDAEVAAGAHANALTDSVAADITPVLTGAHAIDATDSVAADGAFVPLAGHLFVLTDGATTGDAVAVAAAHAYALTESEASDIALAWTGAHVAGALTGSSSADLTFAVEALETHFIALTDGAAAGLVETLSGAHGIVFVDAVCAMSSGGGESGWDDYLLTIGWTP